MAEFVLGVGRGKTPLEVLDMAEAHILRIEGVPLKVHARAKAIELIGSRDDFDSPINHIVLRAHTKGKTIDKMRDAAAEHADACEFREEEDWFVMDCRCDGDPKAEGAFAALDDFAHNAALPEVWRVEGDEFRIEHISPELLFQAMIKYKASDAHLCPGQSPAFRVDSEMHPSELMGTLSSKQILALIREMCTDRDWKEFEEHKQNSFNYHQVGLGYTRASAFVKGGAPHLTLRFLPETIPSFEDLQIPAQTMQQLATTHHGLILVTGMTGSGKSTTVAALIDWINTNRHLHILSIENPVEYVHKNKQSIISQRDTGVDVDTFAEGVRGALRHDPDVIVIGEMRDADTIRSAISAAATGHLVISTLHANTAAEVVNRIVSFFDPVERDLVKLQLRDSLRCVICQRLVPKVKGGRVPALEFMFNDINAINVSILAGDTDAIRVGMQQSASHSRIFEEYILELYHEGVIDLDHAKEYCTDLSTLEQMLMGTYTVPRLESIKAAHMGPH